jgi:hypothetical protein
VVAVMMMVKGTLYPLALIGMAVFMAGAGVPEAGSMTPFWIFFFVASLIASAFLFGNMREAQSEPKEAPGPETRETRLSPQR